jgi:hypothetical protein
LVASPAAYSRFSILPIPNASGRGDSYHVNARQLRVEFGESEQWTLFPLATGAITGNLSDYGRGTRENRAPTVVQMQAQIAAEVVGRIRWGINE